MELFPEYSPCEEAVSLLVERANFQPLLISRVVLIAHAAICKERFELTRVLAICQEAIDCYSHLFSNVELDGIEIQFLFKKTVKLGNRNEILNFVNFFEFLLQDLYGKVIYGYEFA
ncbi:hypothetical protein AC623_18210 [Bacillus sp. FJAT-27231]|uniref:hypothetical protein n=1 Tax=Bacillus sp. FJAT-27231 TaxID=1679168 RepID=UPI0006713CC3|nr:hypothetical protein [Bacillus sp. FJAT-27231]KMY55624.1 hypothetical protein AC623_18210 [Bacillus sp. FJAT-27231]